MRSFNLFEGELDETSTRRGMARLRRVPAGASNGCYVPPTGRSGALVVSDSRGLIGDIGN